MSVRPVKTQIRQNQQNDCVPSEDSDKHRADAQAYLNLRWAHSHFVGCPGLFESSLGAQTFCWFCHVAVNLGPNSKVMQQFSKSLGKF